MIDGGDLELLRRAAGDRGLDVAITVSGCAYSCCSRGWRRRDGYEQVYQGYVDNLDADAQQDPVRVGTFMLYGRGIGTISYVVAVRFSEVLGVEVVD